MSQKQRQRERPPTASEARQWYADGWIDEDGLDQLLETAMETYGGDGDQEFVEVAGGIETTKGKAEKIEALRQRANQKPGQGTTPGTGFGLSDFMFVVAVGFALGIILTLAVLMAFPDFAADLLNIGGREPLPLTVF